MVATVGSISIDLSTNVAKFASGFRSAATTVDRESGRMARSVKGVEVAMAGMGGVARGALGALAGFVSVGAVVRAFVTNTIEAEKALKQLEAAIVSTGGKAGLTVADLQGIASSLQSVTTFGDEAIQSAEAILLTFTKIGRQVFPQATEAALDLATRMGTDLSSATLQLGKALNDPIKGINSLTRAGVQFNEEQKKTIANMIRSGNLAGAQAVILKELQTQFGGSARAARQTLGGALEGLSNAWGDLFEISGKSSEGVRRAIEDMSATISSPQFKEAANTIGETLFVVFKAIAEQAKLIADEINRLETAMEQFNANPSAANFFNLLGGRLEEGGLADQVRDMFNSMAADSSTSAEQIKADIAEIEAKIFDLIQLGGEFDLLNAEKLAEDAEHMRSQLARIEASAISAANAVRAAFAQQFRESENASMTSLDALRRQQNGGLLSGAGGNTGFTTDPDSGRGIKRFSSDVTDAVDEGTQVQRQSSRTLTDIERDLGGYFSGLGSQLSGGFNQINTTFANLGQTLQALYAAGITNPEINYGTRMAGDNPLGSTLSVSRKKIVALGSAPLGTSPLNDMLSRESTRSVEMQGTFSGANINLTYQAAPGESEKTSRQRARDMFDELQREAARR